MDFQTYLEKIKGEQCSRWDDRQRRLHALDLIRTGAHYEALKELKDFEEARSSKPAFGDTSDYVPVAKRRPATEYDLPAIIVRDSVSMLFSEAKFPTVVYEAESDTDAANEIIKAAKLREIMPKAAERGSIGSVFIVPEVFPGDDGEKGVLYLETWKPYECQPVYRRNKPWLLERLPRTWFVTREALHADGYDVEALDAKWRKYEAAKGWLNPQQIAGIGGNGAEQKRYQEWYLRRELNDKESAWFIPIPKHIYEKAGWDEWERDDERTTRHGLGFVPALSVLNMGADTWPDGHCTFRGAINNSFFMDRVMSVGGQAIITAGLPQLAVSKPGGANTYGSDEGSNIGLGGKKNLAPDEVIEVEEAGGAWLLQMSSEAVDALDKYARLLRTISIENCGGSRISEESLTGAKSGYALELLNQPLILVTDLLRLSYGDGALIPLIEMIDRINKKIPIEGIEKRLSDKPKLKELSWPPYYEPTGQDKMSEVQAVQLARDSGWITDETAASNVAPMFDVLDPLGEVQAALKSREDAAQVEHDRAVDLEKVKGSFKSRPAVGA